VKTLAKNGMKLMLIDVDRTLTGTQIALKADATEYAITD